MKVIEVNHKTAAKLLKKSVEAFWLDKNKDAWVYFTDGSAVCVHLLEWVYSAYVMFEGSELCTKVNFCDEQGIYWFPKEDSNEAAITDRVVSLDFDIVRYYYHRQFNGATRQYIPVIEFHYYENGEEIGSND